jgi:hypothetical protein
MRTTLAINDEVFLYARAHAQRENISIGEAVSRLALAGIRAENSSAPNLPTPKSKFALLPTHDEIITTEHVRQLMDQEGI